MSRGEDSRNSRDGPNQQVAARSRRCEVPARSGSFRRSDARVDRRGRFLQSGPDSNPVFHASLSAAAITARPWPRPWKSGRVATFSMIPCCCPPRKRFRRGDQHAGRDDPCICIGHEHRQAPRAPASRPRSVRPARPARRSGLTSEAANSASSAPRSPGHRGAARGVRHRAFPSIIGLWQLDDPIALAWQSNRIFGIRFEDAGGFCKQRRHGRCIQIVKALETRNIVASIGRACRVTNRVRDRNMFRDEIRAIGR